MTAIEFSYQLNNLEGKLYHFAHILTSNTEDAKDLLQDTMLKAITHRNQFIESTNLQAWTYTIMKNTFINNYRRNVRHRTLFDRADDLFFLNKNISHSSPDTAYSVKELNQFINNLKDELKLPFKMHLDGYKYKEIADRLDLNIGTVKSRIYFARQKLMKALAELN